MDFVIIENLWVKYKDFVAVDSLSMSIPKGEVFGFIGPNGAGKTSTIKVLATLIQPAWGKVVIGGHDVVLEQEQVRRKIGYMPDFFGVYEDLTVSEYLDFFAAAFDIEYAKRRSIIEGVLELTDLAQKKDSHVEGLSRGMKQRLSVARLLIHDPDLLLLDEPASGLDPRARIEMRELFKELQAMGKTILISSHILSELGQICTRIGIIEAGKLIAEGSLDDIFAALNLKRKVHVQITNYSDDLLKKIQNIPGVHSAQHQGDRICIEAEENRIAIEDLLDRIRELDARIWMFQPDALDMETAFMKLTEGKLA